MTVSRLFVAAAVLLTACAKGGEPTAPAEGAVIGGEATSEYPDVGLVTSGCTATLIHPRVMLTASHCCQRETTCAKVKIAGRTIATRPIVHPDFHVAPGGGIAPSYDVTLLAMAEPVLGILPRALARTAPEVGREIRFVGFGCTALGGPGFGVKRTGTNTVAFFGADVNGNDVERFKDVFGWKSSASPALDGGTPNDDANICPGDSGGPTLWEEDGRLVVAGVHSLVGSGFGYSCEVAARREWIESQILSIVADAGLDGG